MTRRTAGAALLVYALATFAANSLIAAPGGEYESKTVTDFASSGHYAIAFAAAYIGCLGAVALLPFVLGMRAEIGHLGELAWGLGVAAATAGVIGWFITGGVDVAMAEGGSIVKAGVTNPTVYTLTEIGNLLSWCAPALFMGDVAHPALPDDVSAPLAAGLLRRCRCVRNPRAVLLHLLHLPALDIGPRPHPRRASRHSNICRTSSGVLGLSS